MREVRLLAVGGVSEQIQKRFSDLKSSLENALIYARSLPEIEVVLSSLNLALQEGWLTAEYKSELRRIRQRTYDRRKTIRPADPLELPRTEGQYLVKNIAPIVKVEDFLGQSGEKFSFTAGVLKGLRSIDGEYLVRQLPVFLLFGVCISLTTALLWLQSVSLYQSSGFSDPKLVAFGAVLMMIGFAVIHGVTKSKVALLLCLYVSSYEVFFIISGTFKDESTVQVRKVENEPQLLWLKEKIARAAEVYQGGKKNYEDPTSKVYRNSWYKEKHLDPIWQEYSSAQENFTAKKAELLAHSSDVNSVGILKILYRLGLVFLCMMSVHGLTRRVGMK